MIIKCYVAVCAWLFSSKIEWKPRHHLKLAYHLYLNEGEFPHVAYKRGSAYTQYTSIKKISNMSNWSSVQNSKWSHVCQVIKFSVKKYLDRDLHFPDIFWVISAWNCGCSCFFSWRFPSGTTVWGALRRRNLCRIPSLSLIRFSL